MRPFYPAPWNHLTGHHKNPGLPHLVSIIESPAMDASSRRLLFVVGRSLSLEPVGTLRCD